MHAKPLAILRMRFRAHDAQVGEGDLPEDVPRHGQGPSQAAPRQEEEKDHQDRYAHDQVHESYARAAPLNREPHDPFEAERNFESESHLAQPGQRGEHLRERGGVHALGPLKFSL